MSKESDQKKLDRVRPPRVNIKYEVEKGNAFEQKELPFVMGVLGDFTGKPSEPLPKLKDRKFVEVTPDNFDTVLAGMKPHLSFSVKDTLSTGEKAGQDTVSDGEKGKLKVDLTFKSLDDFSPENVAAQVKPLKELLELRRKLADLRGSLQGNDKLDEVLQDVIGNTEKLGKLKAEMKPKDSGGSK